MQKLFGILVAIATIVATSLPANAGDWRRDYRHYGRTVVVERHYYHHMPRRLVRPRYHHRHVDGGAVAAAGILGLAIGVIVAGEVARRNTTEPETVWIHCEGPHAASELARCPVGHQKMYRIPR